MNLHKIKSPLLTLLVILTMMLSVNCLEAQQQKLITPEEYGKWELLRNTAISKDGNWSSYQVDQVNKDKTIFLYNIKKQTTSAYQNAAGAKFSETGAWFVYEKVLSGKAQKAKEKKKDKKEGPQINDKVLVNLTSSDTLLLKGVKKYSFSEKDSYLAMLRENEGLNTLLIKDLKTQSQISFGNIKSFEWQKEGELLAMIVETKDSTANGIQLYDGNSGTLKVLDQSAHIFSHLEWGEKADYLFAIKAINQERSEEQSYQLLHWKDCSTLNPVFSRFDPSAAAAFPDARRILADNIYLSDDGNTVFFETFSWIQTEKKEEAKSEKGDKNKAKEIDEYEAPDLEIWHSKDELMITQQKKSPNKDSEDPILFVWHVGKNSTLALSNELVENVRLQANNKMMIGLDQTPYSFDAMFGRPSYDIYLLNIENGKQKKVLTNIRRTSPISPDSKYFIYIKDDNLHLYDIVKGSSANITSSLKGQFIQGDSYDYPVEEKPPFSGGFSAWSKDGSSFLFNSEFDVWQGFVNGNPSKRLTKGKEEEIIYRHWLVYQEDKFIDLDKEQFFSMRGKKSKKSGYAKGMLGQKLKTLIYDEAGTYGLDQPHLGLDLVTYKSQSFDQSPNLSISDLDFSNTRKVSNTNPFQEEYAWGKAELITFNNAKNKSAQGILYYPANYQKGEKYPMITYVYEKLSDGLHRYTAPSKTNYYNTTVWQQEGYFVLKPDIEFIAGDPGVSSAKTLENAVAAVIKKGDVDPSKVGLIGHSWGGYQAGFVPTQTDIFAASVAGAGLTNFISMYLAITPAFGGSPENNHFEISQERMISPPWKSPENYIRNSSVMNVESLNTPLLFEVGDNDMNVNWRQGIEYYNAARRAGKQFVLLVYAKEGHGVRQEKNASDYQQKILRWFGHYLKGEEAQDWILDGIPYREQQRRLKKGGQ